MPEPPVEHILVVPTSLFHELGHFNGFCSDVERYLDRLLDPAVMSYRPRPQMEGDPSFKQLIPYVIFQHVAEDGTISVFTYTRGAGQGEARLHAKRSVGVGGHISREDAATDAANPYEEGLQRELAEEVEIAAGFTPRLVGLINDDETEVGRVHLGMVHVYDMRSPDVRPREQDLLDGRFLPANDLLADLDRFETWSRHCLRALYAARGEADTT